MTDYYGTKRGPKIKGTLVDGYCPQCKRKCKVDITIIQGSLEDLKQPIATLCPECEHDRRRVVDVRMEAFGNGEIRKVTIPWDESMSIPQTLERVFMYGQNDFQPQPMPSVSVGDVVLLAGKEWRVSIVGFEEVNNDDNNRDS